MEKAAGKMINANPLPPFSFYRLPFTLCLLSLLPSSFLYAADLLPFSHLKHAGENGQECAVCHPAVAASEKLDSSLRVSLETCRECHDSLPLKAPGFRLTGPSFRLGEKFRPGFLVFPHALHVTGQKMDCRSCHGDLIVDPKKRNEKPRMAECAQCHRHRGQPDLACLDCHDRRDKPADHQSAAWRKKPGHGLESRFNGEQCQLCHLESSCLECHHGATGRPVHDLNYRYTHSVDVRFKKLDCAVCHETSRFCADCHEGRGR